MCNNANHHQFVHRVNDASRGANVSQETFEAWQSEIRHGFTSHNAPALPVEALRDQSPKVVDNFCIDTRTFTDHHNQIAVCFQSLHGTAIVQSEQMGVMSKCTDALESELKECGSEQKCSRELLESIADCIAADYQNSPFQKNQKAVNNDKVLPFSASCEHLKCNPRLVDMFVCFFDDEAKLGCCSEMHGASASQTHSIGRKQ